MEIITFSDLKQNFETAIESVPNPRMIIEMEIDEIRNFINNIPAIKHLKKPVKTMSENHSSRVFKINVSDINRSVLSAAFNDCMLTGSSKPFQNIGDTDEMKSIKILVNKQATEFYKYFEWLNESLNKTNSKAKQVVSLNHQEKLIALYYLGVDLSNEENSKAANLLGGILGLSIQNTRDHLTYLYSDGIKNPVRTKKHFENVALVFNNQGFSEIAKVITSDIIKLKSNL